MRHFRLAHRGRPAPAEDPGRPRAIPERRSQNPRLECRGGDARRAPDHVDRADHQADRARPSSSTAPPERDDERGPVLGHRDRSSASRTTTATRTRASATGRCRATAGASRWPTSAGSASSTPRRAGPERTIELPGSWGGRPAFSPDGTLVAMPIDNYDRALRGLDRPAAAPRREHARRGTWHRAAWSPSGDRIVTGHDDGFVRVWDAATGKLIWHKLLAPVISRSGWNARPAFVSFSRDGKLVVAAGRAG